MFDLGMKEKQWEIWECTRCVLHSTKPKKGRWVPVTNGRGGNECSVCHSYAPSYKNGDEHLSAYCPNCGARMEVVE